MDFDKLFDGSRLPFVLKQAKTLSKEECRAIFCYMEENRPKTMLEFGTQFGCSTGVFVQFSKWLGLDVRIHSWDIRDQVNKICVDRKDFTLHIEDVTGREEKTIIKYCPDMVFLDAHPYCMTKALMLACLKHKINYLTHDVAINLYEDLKIRSKNFTKLNTYGAWELYILTEIFSNSLLVEKRYEDDRAIVEIIRDKYGLSIIKVKHNNADQ